MADNSATGATNFSDVDKKFFVSVMKNLTSDIQFDAAAVASELGYKDGGVAKVRWGQIKRKNGIGGAAGGVSKGSPNKVANATPKKSSNGDTGSDGEKTPIKTSKSKKGKASKLATIKKEVVDEDCEGVGEADGA